MPQDAKFNTADTPHSAFISHASADAGLARELCAHLESQGVQCWIAPRNLIPGNPYAGEIVRGIESTNALILLATPAAVSSNNVLNELEQAHRLHKTLLTVMVGKPQVSRQLSYYIARLHWIEAASTSMVDVAERLARALQGSAPWEKVAARPSFSRWLVYGLWRRFLVPAITTAIVLLVAAWVSLHYLRAQLNTDYRSLGWLTLDGRQASQNAPIQMGIRVWIADDKTPLYEVSIRGSLERKGQPIQEIDLLGQARLESGNGQELLFTLPPGADHIVTCLTVPSAAPGARYRVTQNFAITAGDTTLDVTQAGSAAVTREDGSPCGP